MPGLTQKVTLTLKNGYVVAKPAHIPDRMIGDKLRFDFPNGKFKVVFDKWIFSGKDHPITDRRARTIRKRGRYNLECYIMAPSVQGKWGSPQAGYGYKRGSGARGNVKP